jgi:hypothetical protein
MNRSIRGTLAATVVAIVAMAFASVAGAAVTESHVDAPGSPHFSIAMPGSETVAVTGTSDGTTGDKVDLRCYSNGNTFSFLLAEEIPVTAGGTFSVPNAELENISRSACILRAVPAGTEPSSLAAYTGPLMATGESTEDKVGSGPNAGRLYNYDVWAQQQTASFEYVSAGICGINYGRLLDSSLAITTMTFACNDGFFVETGEFDRSGILVDGSNAYLSVNADEFSFEATNLPAISYTVSQDPANGDTTIQESDTISFCSTATFPPDSVSCPSFVDTGVRLDRTIVQSNDGHLATITDHFVSVDGKPHTVDTLIENEQYFNGNGEKVEYRFPGQTGYLKPVSKQVVAFPDATPGTIYARVEGSPDGTTSTGRGAIVFADPSSPATFAEIGGASELHLHQTATIPAGGSVTKRFAYAQAYTQAEVEALARQAEAAFQPIVPTPAPTPATTPVHSTPAPAPAVPSNKIKVLGAKLNPKKGTALLRVQVPGAGKLTLGGKKVKPVKHAAKRAGTLKLTVAAKPKFAKSLAKGGKLKVAFKLAFTPSGGKQRVVTKQLTLVEK